MQLATPFLILSSTLPSGKTAKRHSKSAPTEASVSEQVIASDTVTESATKETNNLGKLLASCCDCV